MTESRKIDTYHIHTYIHTHTHTYIGHDVTESRKIAAERESVAKELQTTYIHTYIHTYIRRPRCDRVT